ncbi:MAG: hypothetical protein JW770_05525 [Actinobacteria bacterium]|nr:hypothetical protein [Actinomycetota bacterium]
MIRTSTNSTVIEETKKLDDNMESDEEGFPLKSFSIVVSLGIIIILNLVEIGYFIYCVYVFNNIVVTAGSSVLVGYTIYSMIKFFPRIRQFVKKPFMYLMERSEGYESVINFIMVSLEIMFCSYILVLVFLNFQFF